ncbi:MAG: hypothetical protein RL885_12980 [Planctomycetota bacterium]
MRKIRELLRLRWGEGLSQAAVARSLSVASSTVWECENRAKTAGLSWPLPEDLDDASLETLLYHSGGGQEIERAKPDFGAIHKELGKRHVTLQLLWQEYKEAHPEDGYQYSRFCDLYRQYRSQQVPRSISFPPIGGITSVTRTERAWRRHWPAPKTTCARVG